MLPHVPLDRIVLETDSPYSRLRRIAASETSRVTPPWSRTVWRSWSAKMSRQWPNHNGQRRSSFNLNG